jgi:O-methyltransferase
MPRLYGGTVSQMQLDLLQAARQYSVNDALRLQLLHEHALAQSRLQEGDMLELGVYRGGSALLLADAVASHAPNSRVHLLDSWQGLPQPGPQDVGTIARSGIFADTSKEEVESLLRHYALAGVCRFHVGWFIETLPRIPGPFSLVHIDCDFYAAVRESLRVVLPRMSPHGILIIDDYGTPQLRRFPGVERAVAECLQQEGSTWRVRALGGERDQSVMMERSILQV